MRTGIITAGLILLLRCGPVLSQDSTQDTLPDNHLLFTLKKVDNRLEGANKYLEGFRITINLPDDTYQPELDSNGLRLMIQNQEITGVLDYPNGKSTLIEFEIVNHRGKEDIYMKTTLGYFLWESYKVHKDEIDFVINWCYCPPACDADLQILEMAESLLTDSSLWHQSDDRKCDDDIEIGVWSLFCALKYASISIMDEYNHHNTAMQSVRSVIDEMVPNHGFPHTLMDFNNAPNTTHSDILGVLGKAKDRIRQELHPDSE